MHYRENIKEPKWDNFNGNIFSGGNKIVIKESSIWALQLLIALFAKVEKIGSANFLGRIVADEFANKGSGNIIYVDCTDSNHQTDYHYSCMKSVIDGHISIEAFENYGNDHSDSTIVDGSFIIKHLSATKELISK